VNSKNLFSTCFRPKIFRNLNKHILKPKTLSKSVLIFKIVPNKRQINGSQSNFSNMFKGRNHFH
jgi:hypothetical protein